MSTPDDGNSATSKKRLVVVGGETTGASAPEGKDSGASDSAARAIFSKLVLKTESQDDYDSLVAGLRSACQPKGTLEETLVEKLAAILWRYRRLITAESGEIGSNLNALRRVDIRLKERDRLQSEVLRRRESLQGVIGMIYDPEFLSDCLRELQSLRDSIQANGFRYCIADEAVLMKLYGQQISSSGHPWVTMYDRNSLPDTYEKWSRTAKATEEKRRNNPNLASTQTCREMVVQAIEKEIQRLREIQNALNESQPERMELEQLRRNLPDADRMEHLLRYEASLERAFDRTLAQLGRLQRTRLGQGMARPLKLGIPA